MEKAQGSSTATARRPSCWPASCHRAHLRPHRGRRRAHVVRTPFVTYNVIGGLLWAVGIHQPRLRPGRPGPVGRGNPRAGHPSASSASPSCPSSSRSSEPGGSPPRPRGASREHEREILAPRSPRTEPPGWTPPRAHFTTGRARPAPVGIGGRRAPAPAHRPAHPERGGAHRGEPDQHHRPDLRQAGTRHQPPEVTAGAGPGREVQSGAAATVTGGASVKARARPSGGWRPAACPPGGDGRDRQQHGQGRRRPPGAGERHEGSGHEDDGRRSTHQPRPLWRTPRPRAI